MEHEKLTKDLDDLHRNGIAICDLAHNLTKDLENYRRDQGDLLLTEK